MSFGERKWRQSKTEPRLQGPKRGEKDDEKRDKCSSLLSSEF